MKLSICRANMECLYNLKHLTLTLLGFSAAAQWKQGTRNICSSLSRRVINNTDTSPIIVFLCPLNFKYKEKLALLSIDKGNKYVVERKGFVNIFSRTKTIVSPVAVGWSSEMSEWRSFVIFGVNPRRGSVYACLVFCPTQTLLEMRPWKFIITLLPEYQHNPSSSSPSATLSADLCHVFMLATCLPPPTMNETYMWPQAISADKVPAECSFTLEKTITFLSV